MVAAAPTGGRRWPAAKRNVHANATRVKSGTPSRGRAPNPASGMTNTVVSASALLQACPLWSAALKRAFDQTFRRALLVRPQTPPLGSSRRLLADCRGRFAAPPVAVAAGAARLSRRSLLRALAGRAHVVDEVRIRPSRLFRTALRRRLFGGRQMMSGPVVLLLRIRAIPGCFRAGGAFVAMTTPSEGCEASRGPLCGEARAVKRGPPAARAGNRSADTPVRRPRPGERHRQATGAAT
jgi:hypothetical protein